MILRRSIHKSPRKLGVDIVRYPLPDWLALPEHLLTVFSTFRDVGTEGLGMEAPAPAREAFPQAAHPVGLKVSVTRPDT
jgi:hypothetical protein